MGQLAYKVVIPARYASTRLPGKPLLEIAGQPMIIHVCKRAIEAGAEDVVVATDDNRILNCVQAAGFQAVMTGIQHTSGSERLREVADLLQWPDDTAIVNCQGDEPLMPPTLIEKAAQALLGQSRAQVASLCAPIHDLEEVFNPNSVKVVRDQQDYALYFSRAPIPWDRDYFADRVAIEPNACFRHIGIYAYTAGFLRRYVNWPASELEILESLEQLRILSQGEAIYVPAVSEVPPAGVDTQADLDRVAELLTSL